MLIYNTNMKTKCLCWLAIYILCL